MKFFNYKSAILKNTLIYTATDGISKAMSFLTIPLVSHYLLPAQLGIAANFDVLQNIVMLLTGQAIVNSLPYFYYGKEKQEVARLVSNLLLLVVVSNVFLSGIILFTTESIGQYLHINIALQLLTVVSVIAHLLTNTNLILYRLEEKPHIFAILQITQTIIYLILLVTFVIILRMEALGKIYAVVGGFCIMAIVHLVLLVKRGYLVLQINLDDIKRLLKFGIPLLPHSLSFWIKSGMDKVLLTAYCGLAVNGLYSMAMSFGAIYNIFYLAFNNAYVPYLQKRLSLINSDNMTIEKEKIVRLTYKIGSVFILLFFVVVGICWLAIQYVLDPQYLNSFTFVPWIIFSLTINSFYGLVIQYAYTVKKTFGLGIITFSGSIIQLILTYVLITQIGEDGIKYSMVFGSLVITLGVWWYSNKVYPMPWFKRNKITN